MAKFAGRRARLEELAQPSQADHQCAYVTAGGTRCRELGGISDSTTGGGPWYCLDHHREKGTALADQIAEFTYKYQPKPKPSWRDEIVAQRMKEFCLPEKMTFKDFRAKMGHTAMGRALLKQAESPVDYFQMMAETVDF